MSDGQQAISLEQALEEMHLSKEELYAALFGTKPFPVSISKNIVPARFFLSQREWEELKEACKESAGWRCQFIYPNGTRCSNYEGKERHRGYLMVDGKRRERKSMMHMHACHLDGDPENPRPRMLCLCPSHHTRRDRQEEKEAGYAGQGRRGYQLTTTDALLQEVNGSGITIIEQPDGYHWVLDGTDVSGHKRTATAAVAVAVHQLRCQRDQERRRREAAERELAQALEFIQSLQQTKVGTDIR